MAFGRAALFGDAAFAARPHAADTGTAKAAADTWWLAAVVASPFYGGPLSEEVGRTLAGQPVIPQALAAWEPGCVELGHDLLSRVAAMGARSPFTDSWDPADPALRFGLYGPDR